PSQTGRLSSFVLCAPTPLYAGYSYPLDLPSFPTRRSSDLEQPAVAVVAGVEPDDVVSARLQHRRQQATDIAFNSGNQQLHVFVRSEEHTSELQSRENLVCRLLLEKKKKLPERSEELKYRMQ